MSSRIWWRLARYVSPYWEVLAFALAGMIIMAATAPVLAALVKPMVDGAIGSKDHEMLQLVLMGIIALFAIRGLVGYSVAYSINWVGSKLIEDIRIEILDKLFALPAGYFATHSTGSLVFLAVSCTERLAHAFITLATIALKDTFTVIGLLGWAFYLNWQISTIALSAGAFILLIIRPLSDRLEKMRPEMEQSVEGIASVLKESVENYAALKLYRGERYESHRGREQAHGMHRSLVRQLGIAALSVPLWQATIAVALAVFLYYAAGQAAANAITPGGFASVVAAFAMLAGPFSRIAHWRETEKQGRVAAYPILSLLDEQPEPESGAAVIERARGELRFEHVSFAGLQDHGDSISGEQAASECPAGREISLTVRPGEMVALVSFQDRSIKALASLVPLFFHPLGGKIFLDEQDLQGLSLASVRANIGVVSADAALFNDTLAANIAWGDMSQGTEARIMSAAYAAHVSEFARDLPEGMQTKVALQGKSNLPGSQLTPGQRFRVAIARALLKDPPILIVDETGEALDVESVPQAEAALDAVTHGRTTLVVARRLSTIEKADRVILLHKGHITAIGTHTDLLSKNPLYARLARTFI